KIKPSRWNSYPLTKLMVTRELGIEKGFANEEIRHNCCHSRQSMCDTALAQHHMGGGHGGGGFHGGWHGGGGHWGGHGGWGGGHPWGGGWGGVGVGVYPGWDGYYGYADDCYRVWTPYGWRLACDY